MNGKMKKVVFILTLSIIGIAAPLWAQPQGGDNSGRISKLEERMRDLEARMAKVEASSNKQMEMMQHGHDMMNKGMGNNPMGQVPQQNPGTGGAMPQGGAMPPAGMGDM